MNGLKDKISGKVKETAGDLTGDKKLQLEGKAEEIKGTVKDKFNEAVDTVSDKVEEVKDKFNKDK